MKKVSHLFLFTPAYNCQDSIGKVLKQVKDLKFLLDQEKTSLSLLVINDCSSDRTAQIVQEFRKENPFVELQNNQRNLGKADSVIIGYKWALNKAEKVVKEDKDILIGCFDADGEHNPLGFRWHIKEYIIEQGFDGVVGSIIYPYHKIGWADLHMMRFFGYLQSEMARIKDPFYIHSPGYQLYKLRILKVVMEELFPDYKRFFQENYGEFPRWGIQGVIVVLVSLVGARIKSVYLECLGAPPNRDIQKLREQAKAAMDHQIVLLKFFESHFLKNIDKI